jgi:hypothetical protein
MKAKPRYLATLLLAAVFTLPVITTGCVSHGYYRVYDPYDQQYHRWDHENVYYQQWVVETHRDPHRDFRHMNSDEQKEYWKWRQGHHDHDNDHDHDHR